MKMIRFNEGVLINPKKIEAVMVVKSLGDSAVVDVCCNRMSFNRLFDTYEEAMSFAEAIILEVEKYA